MAGYISQIKVDHDDPVLIGSSLYGICATNAAVAAKKITSIEDNSGKFINNNFNNLVQGVTVHIKFIHGNTVASGMTLQIGTTNQAVPVMGSCICETNSIISFTFDENNQWVVNNNMKTTTLHKLTFGAGGVYEYDGSADVTVPVYTGTFISN